MNILWKSFDLSSNDTAFVTKDRSRAEFSAISESSFAQAWRTCGELERGRRWARPRSLNRKL